MALSREYQPSDLQELYKAFDIAWSSIEDEIGKTNRDAVRDAVGAAIMGLARAGHRNTVHLANYGAYQGRCYMDLRG